MLLVSHFYSFLKNTLFGRGLHGERMITVFLLKQANTSPPDSAPDSPEVTLGMAADVILGERSAPPFAFA